MAKAALAFAAGFGTGYLNQTRQNKLDAERQEDRDMRKQEFNAQQEERDRLKADRQGLSKAAEMRETNTNGAVVDGLSTKPVVYEDANVASGDLRQDRRLREATAQAPAAADQQGSGLGLQLPPTPQEEVQDSTAIGVGPQGAPAPAPSAAPTMRQAITSGGQEYATQGEADAATKKFNDGRGERISQELYRQGDPAKAMQMDAAQLQVQEHKRAYAQKMIDEGAKQVAIASRKGDPDAVRAAANASGEYKIDGEIKVVPEAREVPGLGKIPTFNYTFNAVGKDGQPKQMSFNSHDLSMQTMEFDKILDVGMKGRAADDKSAYQMTQADARMKAAEAAETRAGLYGMSRGNGAGAGAGRGTGKAPALPVESAQKILEEQFKPDGTPESAQRNTKALSYLDGVYRTHPELSPRTAAAIAADIATDPKTKLRPQIDKTTGIISQVYQNPDIEQGTTYVIAKNSGSIKDIEAAYGKDGVKAAVQGVLSGMGTTEQQGMFMRAAHDPVYRKQMEASAKEQGADMAVLSRKLDLLKLLPNPDGPKNTKSGGINIRNPFADDSAAPAGGVGLFGQGYVPPAGSPAAQSQAMREQSRAQAQAQATKSDASQQALSTQFQADSKSMAPLELVRKYDALRGRLPTQDAAALKAAEQTL